jgi:hypothetical protein
MTCATLLSAGCGSSKMGSSTPSSAKPPSSSSSTVATVDEAPTSANTLTRAQAINAVNRICAQAYARIARFDPSNNKPGTKDDIAQSARKVAGYERTEASELRGLKVPAALAGDLKQIAEDIKTYSDDTARYGKYIAIYAKTKDPRPGRALVAAGNKVHAHMAAIAERDGFTQCAKATP